MLTPKMKRKFAGEKPIALLEKAYLETLKQVHGNSITDGDLTMETLSEIP